MLELNDSSTSFGRSASVRVGEGFGEEEREDPAMGDEDMSMLSDFASNSPAVSVK